MLVFSVLDRYPRHEQCQVSSFDWSSKIDPIGHDQKPERLLQNNHLIGATLG